MSKLNEVWDVLSRIDVSEHVDTIDATAKRPEVKYLSWSKAWMLVKREFPCATYSHRPDLIHPDGTVEVEVDVHLKGWVQQGPEYERSEMELFTNARLSVMNFFFDAVAKPNAREVNDARQRCLVKALAFAGLGLDLWTGDAVPVGKLDDPINDDEMAEIESLLDETDSDRDRFMKWCDVENLGDLPAERFQSARNLLIAKKARQDIAAKKEAAHEDS